MIAGVEPKPALHKMLQSGLGDKSALHEDYVDEFFQVGGRPGYPTVARGVNQALPNLIAARSHYPEMKAPVHLVHGEKSTPGICSRKACRQPRVGHTRRRTRTRTTTRRSSPGASAAVRQW